MPYVTKEIKQGIKLHLIETSKFKTNLITVVLTLPLTRENVTLNTVIPAVLKRGTNNLKSQDEISKKLEELYGAEFDCGIEKIGDNHVLKFYLETLNDVFLPESYTENLAKEGSNVLLDIILNPYLEENCFKNEYVEQEKNNIKLLIESKIDNKDSYALNRCIEEMYKSEPYGFYKYGFVEDLKKINSKNLYEHYLNIIKKAKIDIFFSGNINKEEITKYIKENENIKKLEGRKTEIVLNTNEKIKNKEIKNVEEKMSITQGKLVIGLDVESKGPDSKFPISIYNVILRRKCYIKVISKCKRKSKFSIYSKIKLCKTKIKYIY